MALSFIFNRVKNILCSGTERLLYFVKENNNGKEGNKSKEVLP